MANNKFYASYSILKLWQAGQWEQVVKYYFKLEKFITPAMKAGQEFHESWEQEIIKTKCLPAVFGAKQLQNPQPEQFFDYDLDTWLVLRGKVDCIDAPDIHEFKTGKQSAESYTTEKQAGVYGVLCTAKEIYVERVFIHHFDQYAKKVDVAMVWLSDKLLSDTMDWILTLSSEIHNYFIENQLYERYGHNRKK